MLRLGEIFLEREEAGRKRTGTETGETRLEGLEELKSFQGMFEKRQENVEKEMTIEDKHIFYCVLQCCQNEDRTEETI